MNNIIRNLLGLACLAFSIAVFAAPVQSPVIIFSDLISAPASGWNKATPEKGAVVTIWGRNFGTSRGNSFVTVNGVRLDSEHDYMDVWGKKNNPVPFLQTITFQLNSAMTSGDGSISVTVNGVTSATLPFRINQSKINFIDINASAGGSGSFEKPYSNPADFIDNMSPGDVAYFRAGTYNRRFNGGKSVIWIRDTKTPGTAQDPIGLLVYPGEVAHMDTLVNGDRSNFNRAFQTNVPHITIAKFRVTAHLRGIWTSHYNRVIGNDVTGVVDHLGGDGAIHSGSQAPLILGNSVHGARSGNKLDHAIYIDGCQNLAGGEVAYNYIYDNDVGKGPLLVDNHQNERCDNNSEFMKSNHWHSNVISAEAYKTRCLGIYDLSWDAGESQEPDPAYVYNNTFIECGDGWSGALYHLNGHAFIFNNTFINSRGKSIQIYDNASNEEMLGATIVNNVFIQKNGVGEVAIENNGADENRIHVDNNYYENTPVYASDANAITGSASAGMTIDSTAYNPVIVNADSPLIDSGSASVATLADVDFYAANRSGKIDIGAVEFFLQLAAPAAPDGILILPN